MMKFKFKKLLSVQPFKIRIQQSDVVRLQKNGN